MPKRTDFKMALKMGSKGTCLTNKQTNKQNKPVYLFSAGHDLCKTSTCFSFSLATY